MLRLSHHYTLKLKLKTNHALLISEKSKGTMFPNILKILDCTLKLIKTYLYLLQNNIV